MVPQILKQSQQLHPALIWTGLKQEAVWWPISPPFGFKILRFESTLKILSNGHKKPQPNYTHKELLTTKTRLKTPLYPGIRQPGTREGFEVIFALIYA